SAPLPALEHTQPLKPLPAGTVLTLPELTEYALRNNPRARQAWFAARAAAAGVGIEMADDLPTITGSMGLSRVRPVSGTSGAESPWQSRFGPSVSLSYVLYDFGVGDDQILAAEYRLLAANLNQNRVLQDIIFQVEQAYYRMLGLDSLVRVNQLALENIKTSLGAAMGRRESGLATVADVYRTETQVAQAELNLTRSKGELEKAKGLLASAVGLPVNSAIQVQTLTTLPQMNQMTTSLNELIERAKKNRPDLIAAEAQARGARATASAVAKSGLPTIEVVASTARTFYEPERVPPSTAYAAALNVRIPLFNGFRETYSRRQSLELASQAEANRDTLARQTELDVWQAYYDLQTAASALSSTEAQVKSAEQTAQATLARYKGGFGTILDLITAQQDESNARVQRIQSHLDWYTAFARLNYSAGSTLLGMRDTK
ncbi:MAG TPA: TolC family protein, partial [Burkholderiales bacterium]|nr:TolC family protein [Burkholderiales bacterium]